MSKRKPMASTLLRSPTQPMTVKELIEAFELVSDYSRIRVSIGKPGMLFDVVTLAVADTCDDEEPYVVLCVEEP